MFKNCVLKPDVNTVKWAKSAGVRAVKTMAQFILIVDAGSGRPPVDDDNIRLIFCNSVLPDIETFRTFISEVIIVDAAKVRFFQSRAIFSKGILGMFQNILTGS